MYSNEIILAIKNKESDPESFDRVRSSMISELVRNKYTPEDEFSIQRTRDTKPEKFKTYNEYVEACIATVDDTIDRYSKL